ncbi:MULTISPECIES: FxDxF family PEP-CTERM protein [Sphingosinicellaceae]|uniref:FxDxF family PEP-CTERM protein n=1 Tax=Sphingosinicellaceae TaxID=2820280 RepID=UPI001C1DF00C|nr:MULTISPECIES: FxDxF family PEP-CTERM protein [Polymorphobacter]QYE35494.1 FxDxF family PEP-CTERM protein [Polymorphobacter sp. PAMC 29334]UAJ11191.1 FxDxF family PEP-CTERM protein [Polymorphobacter megasporae]
MIKILSIAAVALMATQASALTKIVPLGLIVVPPTQTSSLGTTFFTNGDNSAYYEFTVSQPNTAGVSSFTNSAVGKTGFFNFSSIGLYEGLGTSGTLLQTGTIVPRNDGGTTQAYLDEYTFTAGKSYTIAYSGKVVGEPASVGSSITFALAAVPEPASWALMIVGFGMVGYSARRRTAVVTA